jgi:hypothetical protein
MRSSKYLLLSIPPYRTICSFCQKGDSLGYVYTPYQIGDILSSASFAKKIKKATDHSDSSSQLNISFACPPTLDLVPPSSLDFFKIISK